MLIQVNPHKIVLIKTNDVNSGEYNVNECTFEFSQEYEGLTKVAVFSLCDGTTKNITILNNRCIIPTEVLQQTGQVKIGVYGYSVQDDELVLRYSPTPQIFVVTEGSYKEGTEPVAPTPTDWEILVQQVSDNSRDIADIQEDIGDINTDIGNINNAINDLDDKKANINDLSAVAFSGSYNDLINKPNLSVYATKTDLSDEATLRKNADVALQEQIDAISVSSDVVDVVGTYQELLDYDTTHLKDNDIVKVLDDYNHNDALSYYRWDKEPQTWSYIGSEGPFYTKGETQELLNAKEDKITTTNKLDADLVDDSNSTNKFVTEEDITYWDNKEDKSNKVTEINSSSTDTEYPSAKCVYDSQVAQDNEIDTLKMIYNILPTDTDTGETISIDNTGEMPIKSIQLGGNTSQVVIPAETGTNVNATSISISDVNTSKEHTIGIDGNTYQETTSISGGDEYDSPSPDHPQNIEVVTGENTIVISNSDNSQSQRFPVNLGNIELCKIDTYKDRIYKSNDKWYLEKNIGKVAITTNDYITHYSIWHWIGFNKPNNSIMRNNFNNYELYMEKAYYANNRTKIYSYNTSIASEQMGVICYEDDDATTLKQKLDGSLMYYPLATPTTTEITDTSLVNQLNALYNATIYPITNINTDTSNLLPYIDLHYNFVTPSPSPSRPSVVNVVKGDNTITISNSDNTESQTYQVNLPSGMELSKIGTYQDYIYKDSDKWYLHKEIGKVVLNGSEDWSFTGGLGTTYSTVQQNFDYGNANYYSNYFLYGSNDNKITLGTSGSSKTMYMKLLNSFTDVTSSDTSSTIVEKIKSWLSTHNTIVYYALATPTNTQITDTTLINQLDNIKKAYSYDTQTNISQTNEDKPFIITAEMFLSLKNVLN